jgi:hypothetical protein
MYAPAAQPLAGTPTAQDSTPPAQAAADKSSSQSWAIHRAWIGGGLSVAFWAKIQQQFPRLNDATDYVFLVLFGLLVVYVAIACLVQYARKK